MAHGLRSAHWPEAAFDQACERTLGELDEGALWEVSAGHFEDGEVFSDLPCPLIYRRAFAAWPEARFVMVRREPGAWVASVRRHAGGRDLSYLEKFFYWTVCGERLARIDQYSDARLAEGYAGFMRDAQSYLASAGARVGCFALGSPDLARDLAAFMGFQARYPFVKISG
jgi:hypothetical protein